MDWLNVVKLASAVTGACGLIGVIATLVFRHLDRSANEPLESQIGEKYKVDPRLITPILGQLRESDRLKGLAEILRVSNDEAKGLLTRYKVLAPELAQRRGHQLKIAFMVSCLAVVLGGMGVAIAFVQAPQNNGPGPDPKPPDPEKPGPNPPEPEKPGPEPPDPKKPEPDPVPPRPPPPERVQRTEVVHLASVSSVFNDGGDEKSGVWTPPTGCTIVSFERIDPIVHLNGCPDKFGGSNCCPCAVLVERDGDGLRYQIRGIHGSTLNQCRCHVKLYARVILSCPQ